MNPPYRIEYWADAKWHLFLRHRETGEEYKFHAYDSEEIARYNGYMATRNQPRTEDGKRTRRSFMRSI